MPRSLTDALSRVLLVVLAASSGCTLWPGRGWGEADVTLRARFAPDESHRTTDGLLQTSRDYAIALDELTLAVDLVQLGVAEPGSGTALSFDPASPPPGYTLCHLGECHAEDGRIVPYAEVEAELTGTSGAALTVLLAGEPVALSNDPADVEVSDCTDECVLPRGTLASAGVLLDAITVSGTLFDLRTGDDVRLPAGGVAIAGEIPLELLLEAPLDEALDGTEPPGVALELLVSLAPSLFDDIGLAFFVENSLLDFGGAGATALPSVAANVLAGSSLTATVTRTDVHDDASPVLFPQGGNSGDHH